MGMTLALGTLIVLLEVLLTRNGYRQGNLLNPLQGSEWPPQRAVQPQKSIVASGWFQWFTLEILATQEAEIRRIIVQNQLGQMGLKNVS
jgi:hypothetical protein